MRASVESALVVFVIVLSACGGGSSKSSTSPSPQPSGSTAFQGSFAGTGGQSGLLNITIQTAVARFSIPFVAILHAQGTVAASGTATLSGGGGTFNLTGTYDSSTRNVNLSGGGFAFTGTTSQGMASGTYTGSNNMGGFSTLDSTRNSVTAYCGTYRSSGQSGGSGPWNLQVSANGQASGVGIGNRCNTPRGCTVFLNGNVNGTTMNLTGAGSDEFKGVPTAYTITGTVQSGSVSGTYTGTDDSGTFAGSTNGCR